MRTFEIEVTITERRLVEIDADTAESAQGKAKDGYGRWINFPSRLFATKILRIIPTEELESRKERGMKDLKPGV